MPTHPPTHPPTLPTYLTHPTHLSNSPTSLLIQLTHPPTHLPPLYSYIADLNANISQLPSLGPYSKYNVPDENVQGKLEFEWYVLFLLLILLLLLLLLLLFFLVSLPIQTKQ